jgi:hypothetical protein
MYRRGQGGAARAILGILRPDVADVLPPVIGPPAPTGTPEIPFREPIPDAPAEPQAPPASAQGAAPPQPPPKPPQPPAQPPAPPPQPPPRPPAEPPKPPKRKGDSPILQGSSFYVPLMNPEDAWKILWDEWIRAGIGKPRAAAAPGEEDASGRRRGAVLTREELAHLPKVQVQVPGRRGALLVDVEDMLDLDRFTEFLAEWMIDGDVSLVVEGMVSADGESVARNIWIPPGV